MQRGGAGLRSLNSLLHQWLNPPTEMFIERFGHRYCPRDKVMHIVNDRERDIYSGDLGVVTRVDHVEGKLTATFGLMEATFDFGELDALQLAYPSRNAMSASVSVACVALSPSQSIAARARFLS